MAIRIKPRLMKGIRDFKPADMIKRNFVIDTIKKIFHRHGFLPLETPAIEFWEILAGKYGDEGEKLIYRFRDRGDRDLGLRYDLTVSLSRFIAMNQNELVKPFKRYQIQPVWRADKPGKGRFREFYQCDIDVVGTRDILADSEVIFVSYEILRELGFRHFVIKINNRKILFGIVELSGVDSSLDADVCRSIDKLDKIGMEGVEAELIERGISQESVERIKSFIKIKGTPQEVVLQAHTLFQGSEQAIAGVDELSRIRKYLEFMGVPEGNIQIDLSLARGLDYYTGPIFETVVEKPRIGSLTGGGRYDDLIGLYTGMNIPATGNSIGLERIITVMDELDMYPANLGYGIDALICRFQKDDPEYCLKLSRKLREAGINTEVYMGKSGLRGQLGYADDRKIPAAIIAGEDERREGVLTVRIMAKGEQITVPEGELTDKIRELISCS